MRLSKRVDEAIRLWTIALNGKTEDLEEEREANAVLPTINKITLEIRITSQLMTVLPSLELAKSLLLEQLFSWHGIITSQPRISSTRFQVSFYILYFIGVTRPQKWGGGHFQTNFILVSPSLCFFTPIDAKKCEIFFEKCSFIC